MSLGTIGLATILGKRARQHHLESRAAKRTELALRQVGPFTANLPEEERQRVVREFTQRVFIDGNIDSEPSAPRATRLPAKTIREPEQEG